MEQFLGDYGRPRRPFPIFSLSRHDVLLTMFLSLLCLYVAVAIRIGQPATVNGLSPWKGIFVVFGVIWGVIFALLSGLKVFCGYGEYQQPGYNQLSSEDGPSNASAPETNGFQVDEGKFTKNGSNHESNLQRNGNMSTMKVKSSHELRQSRLKIFRTFRISHQSNVIQYYCQKRPCSSLSLLVQADVVAAGFRESKRQKGSRRASVQAPPHYSK